MIAMYVDFVRSKGSPAASCSSCTARGSSTTCEHRRGTASNLFEAIEKASTVSGSTTSGASASAGTTATHTTSRSSTTIEGATDAQGA